MMLVEQAIMATCGMLLVIATIIPWLWNRSIGVRNFVGRRLIISMISAVTVAYTCLWTLADASVTSASGERVLCGGDFLGMLDSRVEKTFGYPHECIVHSRLAIAVIVSTIVIIILLECLALRRFVRQPQQDSTVTH